MPRKLAADSPARDAHLGQETLYVGVDIGKKTHVAGFVSSTLLARHQRFEHCPAFPKLDLV